MGKLVRLELKNELLNKKVVLYIIAVLQVIFFLSALSNSEGGFVLVYSFTIVLGIVTLLYICVEWLIVLFINLQPKYNEMLLLIPCNLYRMVLTKIIVLWIRCFVASSIFIGALLVDTTFWGLNRGDIWTLKEILQILLGINSFEKACDFVVILSTAFVYFYLGAFALVVTNKLFKSVSCKVIWSVFFAFVLGQIIALSTLMLVKQMRAFTYHYLALTIIYMVLTSIPKLLSVFGICILVEKSRA